jgi:TPP-dependent pyruvate/acetoin dehydrogenase alpha subunit
MEQAAFTGLEEEQLRAEVDGLVRDALARAEASPFLDGAEVAEGVYA